MNDFTILCLTVGRVNYDCDINFYEPLKKVFSRVVRYNYLERLKALGLEAMNREVLTIAAAEKPHYIFFITYQGQIQLTTLLQLREMGCRVIAWFSDDHWRFDNYSRHIAPHIFCSCTTDINTYEKYQLFGFPAVLTQWAANPDYYHRIPHGLTYDASFVGQKYGTRSQTLHFLHVNGVPLHVFGRGFETFLEFEDIIRIFNQTRININLSGSSVDPSVKQIKGRTFEVPMCGGFLLTEYAPRLEEFFNIGTEIVTFYNEFEALEKIRYYLSHEEERLTIAEAGYRRAHAEHCWEKRLHQVFKKIIAMT